MTKDELKEAQAACDAAVGGEWKIEDAGDRRMGIRISGYGYTAFLEVTSINELWEKGQPANARFIVLARRALPEALKEIERLQEANKWLEGWRGTSGAKRLEKEVEQLKAENARLSETLDSQMEIG